MTLAFSGLGSVMQACCSTAMSSRTLSSRASGLAVGWHAWQDLPCKLSVILSSMFIHWDSMAGLHHLLNGCPALLAPTMVDVERFENVYFRNACASSTSTILWCCLVRGCQLAQTLPRPPCELFWVPPSCTAVYMCVHSSTWKLRSVDWH